MSLGGYEFSISETRWQLNRNAVLILDEAKERLSRKHYECYVNTLATLAMTRAGRTVLSLNYTFLKFLRFACGAPFQPILMIELRNSGEFNDHQISLLRILLTKWHSLSSVGVSAELISMMGRWELAGNITGDAVKRLHPEEGPLSDLELQNIIEFFALEYERGGINITQFAVALLLQASGRRPWQLMCLRIKDLIKILDGEGFYRYFVDVPRSKQRGGKFRETFRKVQIIRDVWTALELLEENAVRAFSEQLKCDISDEIKNELPLFFSSRQLQRVSSLEELQQLLMGDFLHMTTDELKPVLKAAFRHSKVISERTYKLLKVFPRRFRYTLGTRAAREGYGIQVIAELMDHSNTNNAGVYIQNIPEHGAHIDRVVGEHLAPIALAFSGVVVDGKSHALRGNEPASDIRSHTGEPGGTCSHRGVCGANVPVPCYTCPYFQPWLNGPHQEFHSQLVEQRDAIMRNTGDKAIASILDRTIIAVSEVVQICAERKRKLGDDDEQA